MFKEASIYALKQLSHEERAAYGLRVLIMQRWPRGVARGEVDLWIPSAAPFAELLSAYRAGRMTWHDFTLMYRVSQVMSQSCRVLTYQEHYPPLVENIPLSPLTYLRKLEQKQGVVTLLCWEPGAPCHRFLLQELLENPRIEAEIRATTFCSSGLVPPEEGDQS